MNDRLAGRLDFVVRFMTQHDPAKNGDLAASREHCEKVLEDDLLWKKLQALCEDEVLYASFTRDDPGNHACFTAFIRGIAKSAESLAKVIQLPLPNDLSVMFLDEYPELRKRIEQFEKQHGPILTPDVEENIIQRAITSIIDDVRDNARRLETLKMFNIQSIDFPSDGRDTE